ncbi:F-box protein CPR30-like [Arachis ipaensis]|nr:F-box protein CPR30-like [Arachis ipaensis]XP_025650226.1 F-box protein CPR1-like [Arachis hypogaea]XP_025696960.1 F-box protein CPR1-like [Arachis hypogaea]XP_029152672.1 F-box protein CPR1-like [Arachis hypogaea]QHO09538.1 F-box protein [Arachis hypogaea]
MNILPVELIHRIFLRVPAKHLAGLRYVSKLWYSLISDPHFAELHFHHSPASTNACFVIEKGTVAYFVDLDALFSDNNDALQVRKVSPRFKMESPPHFEVLGSCRGFVLLHQHESFLVVWNPLTGSSKLISHSHIASRFKHKGWLPWEDHPYGFGYDASQDDYLVVVPWHDKHGQDHFDCFSLRTNSWIDFNAALPKPLGFLHWHSPGLFFNGAIHWVPSILNDYRDAILIFDLKERTFSMISVPEQLETRSWIYSGLALLGGCLALYNRNIGRVKTEIWVMKEYKVHSSWTLYQIPTFDFRPLYLSSAMDLIGKRYTPDKSEFYIYNLREERLQHFKYPSFPGAAFEADAVYTESLLPLPSDIKDKDEEGEKGHQFLHDFFEQLDVAKG